MEQILYQITPTLNALVYIGAGAACTWFGYKMGTK